VKIPVLCTGGFQTATVIEQALADQCCDAVTIARPLIANNDLVKVFAGGAAKAEKPCTYCNRCLVNAVANPLGCYEPKRFNTHEEMVQQIMSVFVPHPFPDRSGPA
jgi:2,4-dienoyl-CoA reductase (NADPH2)